MLSKTLLFMLLFFLTFQVTSSEGPRKPIDEILDYDDLVRRFKSSEKRIAALFSKFDTDLEFPPKTSDSSADAKKFMEEFDQSMKEVQDAIIEREAISDEIESNTFALSSTPTREDRKYRVLNYDYSRSPYKYSSLRMKYRDLLRKYEEYNKREVSPTNLARVLSKLNEVDGAVAGECTLSGLNFKEGGSLEFNLKRVFYDVASREMHEEKESYDFNLSDDVKVHYSYVLNDRAKEVHPSGKVIEKYTVSVGDYYLDIGVVDGQVEYAYVSQDTIFSRLGFDKKTSDCRRSTHLYDLERKARFIDNSPRNLNLPSGAVLERFVDQHSPDTIDK